MDLASKIESIIKFFCKNKQMFTSLDISNHVKQHVDSRVAHRDVAKIVRHVFIDGLLNRYYYTRTLITVTLGSKKDLQVYLYHNQNDNIDTYSIRNQLPVIPNNCATKETNWVSVADTNEFILLSDKNGKYRVQSKNNVNEEVICVSRKRKNDGRLEIPNQWIQGLGWQERKQVNVLKGDNTLILADNIEVGDEVLCTTHISHGRLRVPKTAFAKASMNSEKCKIEKLDNCFVVWPLEENQLSFVS